MRGTDRAAARLVGGGGWYLRRTRSRVRKEVSMLRGISTVNNRHYLDILGNRGGAQ
jgi:hypothetical protein